MKCFLLVFIYCQIHLSAFFLLAASPLSKTDSLRNSLVKAQTTEQRIDITNELCAELIAQKDKEAQDLINLNISLAQQSNYKKGLGEALRLQGEFLFNESKYDDAVTAFREALPFLKQANHYRSVAECKISMGIAFSYLAKSDSAIALHQKALQIAQEIEDTSLIARANINVGNYYFNIGEYSMAFEYQTDALRHSQIARDTSLIVMANNNLGNIHYMQGNFQKALEYHQESLKGKLALGSMASAAVTLNNLGAISYVSELYSQSLDYYQEAASINAELGLKSRLAGNYSNIGLVYSDLEDYQQALRFYLKTQQIIEETGNQSLLPPVLNNIALMYRKTQNYDQARRYYTNAINEANAQGNRSVARDALKGLSILYEENGNFKNALNYYKQFKQVNDSLVNENAKNRIAELEIKYEVERKEFEIERLNHANELHIIFAEKKRLQTIYIISGIILFAILAFLVFWTRTNLLTQRKISQKTIETEEAERKRFSADIHDGLGPVLTGLKLLLSSTSALNKEQEESISKARYMVDEGVKDVRSIVNNMTPTTIENDPFAEVLLGFCNRMSCASGLEINISTCDIDGVLNSAYKITIYRVITELVNNTIKYAQAKKIDIQLEKRNNKIHLIYSDDGVGFDIKSARKKSGGGLNNINNRVLSLGGKWALFSKSKGGMKAEITLNL